MKLRILVICGILLLLGGTAHRTLVSGQAQVPPPSLAEALYRLPVYLRVLHTGAHPDDENNSLLVYLSRQVFARAAYLSATRGDGGQNLIGNELGEALGVLRTEELLAAQRVEAVDQYFTRAYDFGFTRSAEETLSKWGHEEILSDFVRVIRRFRPDIIISRFSGTPNDGHGQHQAAGILTKEAFRAAGDPNRFPDDGPPWQARKLYLNRGRLAENTGGVSIDLGLQSALLGRSYAEMGIEARNYHRSQFQTLGPRRGSFVTSLQLLDAVPPVSEPAVDRQLFDGLNVSLTRIADFVSEPETSRIRVELAGIEKQAREAIAAFEASKPQEILPLLRSARRRLWELRSFVVQTSSSPSPDRAEAYFAWSEKLADFDFALERALGLEVSVRAGSTTVTPGETAQITVTYANKGQLPLTVMQYPIGDPVSDELRSRSGVGAIMRMSRKISAGQTDVYPTPPLEVPESTPVTQPYWLRLPRIGDRFQVEPRHLIGFPQAPAPFRFVTAIVMSDLPGDQLNIARDVIGAPANNTTSDRRDILKVVPKLSLDVSPAVLIAKPGDTRRRKSLDVIVTSQTASKLQGSVELLLPKGWKSEPLSRSFVLNGRDQTATLTFNIALPNQLEPGSYAIRAAAKIGNETFGQTMTVIRYPHVNSNYLYRPAEARVAAFDVEVAPNLKVGYVAAHGDLMPPALRALGVTVSEIDGAMLAAGDLSGFDCIIVGPRAYEGREDLVKQNGRLLQYVEQGGTMIVQYQVVSFNDKGFAPFRLRIANDERVTDEKAEVRVLDPNHPLFRFPNQITDRDFAGWVQERGLYFATSWDEKAFKPLLESHDGGERERNGGMLIADYGKGHYIYTAYAWFRQLPAGVPGAYRLFANLLSFSKFPGRK